MKAIKTFLALLCLAAFSWQAPAQSLVEIYTGTSLPTAQGWAELRFDSTRVWEQAAKNLLVPPVELSAVAGAALKLKVNEATDGEGYPLYSQLGWYKSNVGFSPAIGYTVEFKAKIINSPNGAFTLSGVGGGKGFRLEFSNSLLTEHADVLDTVRVLSAASTTDDYHVYRVAISPDEKVYIWRDGVLLDELPLQPFKLDNIFKDGGFENGEDALTHGWSWTDEGKTGTLTVSDDPNYVHTGKYGLFVDKGFHKNEFIPVKSGAIYDVSAWGKTISYPDGDGHWRDLQGWHDPAGDKSVYFVGDKANPNWKLYEKKNMEGGAHFQRFIFETTTGDANDNQMAYDDIHYAERITPSRIPAGAVNLFPNGDFENPCAHYFPEGDPRNDTCMVNPNNYRYSADAYYGGREDGDATWFGGSFNAEHNAAPFWHPFWGARVRVQYNRQTGNDEAGNHYARGKYSLRFFNCFGSNVEYGNDFSSGQNEDRGSNSNIKTVPINLKTDTKYTFLFSYHFAKWGGDRLILVVKNGNTELFRKTINNENFDNWTNAVIEFTTDADNHALQILTERDGSTPGVIYLDDLYLFEGELLPEDNTHLFFGKQTSVVGAEADIEYVKIDNTGSFAPDGSFVGTSVWHKKTAPLMTVWGEALPETAPLSPILDEYPRPQLKREGWTNLNGIWDYTRKTKESLGVYDADETYRQEILVPYPVESALSGIMDNDYTNQSKVFVYKREVTIAKPTDGKRVILHFGAVDWESYVYVNGQEAAHHKGGFDPFSADITDKLNDNGTQEIVVQAFDPTRGGQPSGKQDLIPGATSYSPASGIWQTVWTETVNPTYVTNLILTPVNNSAVRVKVEAAGDAGATATVKVLDGANEVAMANVAVGAETTINIPSPKLWSPESPFLYNVKVELKNGATTTDEVASYFGLREVEVKVLRDKPFVHLNGEPTFSYATLDHGYFPDGLYTPASYDAMRHDLLKLKELGFNAVRKFEKIEPAIWYHLADSLGLLVWQDIPAAHTGTPISELSTEAARKANFLRETEAMIKSIRNFPSVVAWIGFNDSWGQYEGTIFHTQNTVNLFRSLNDGRLVVPESGGDHFELGDVVSSHGLPTPNVHTNAYNERAMICGVTGNYNYAIVGHTWNAGSSSDIKNDSTYAARLKEFADAAKILTLAGLSGVAMVQTTDVENEINGLLTYDRKVYKAGLKADSVLKSSTDFMKTKITVPVVKRSAQGGEEWKYVSGARGMDAPGAGWYNDLNFDDSDWKTGRSAFGGNMTVSFPWNTEWKGDNIEMYLRKIVHIPVLAEGDTLQFTIFYDEDYELYINGILAHANTGWSTSYVSFAIDPAAAAAINYGGDNLFAIHIVQGNGGSCMDLGVTAESLSNPIDYEPEPVPVVWKNIATAVDWANIKNDLNGFYRLVNDIDLNGIAYAPIGSTAMPFKGYIDGQNHTVTCPEFRGGDRLGLFNYADGAHFVNLRFTEACVFGEGGNDDRGTGSADVGILLGRGKGIHVEHVVFDDDGQYRNEVHGGDHVGIVAGYLEAGKLSTIKNVYVVNGRVFSTGFQAGGLVGIINDTRIIHSYYTGSVYITHENRLTANNRDASGIVSRTEGGKNYFNGVISLADSVSSASGNEFISFNGGGYIIIDSATCFTRSDMLLDPLIDPTRNGQHARASESMKRSIDDFKTCDIYKTAGWNFDDVWGLPRGGGFPIFRTIEGAEFEEDCVGNSLPKVKVINNDLKVYSIGEGNLVLEASQPTAVWIYNLQGMLVERIDVGLRQTVTLPSGIYIVNSVQNGSVKAVKVINR